MLVQRLTKWLTNLLARVTMRRHPTGLSQSGAGHSGRSAAGSRAQQAGSWLDDARRLRPPRSALATADPPHAQDGTPREGYVRPAERLIGRSAMPTHPLKPANATPQNPPQPPKRLPAPSAPQQPAVASVPSGDRAADGATADGQAGRRLMSLKYLVRIGLYNEGFPPGTLPEQYHRSVSGDGDEDVSE